MLVKETDVHMLRQFIVLFVTAKNMPEQRRKFQRVRHNFLITKPIQGLIMDWDWKKFYDKAYDWVIMQSPKILIALIILLLGLWVIRKFNNWLRKGMERKRFNPSLRYFFLNLVAISLQIFLAVMVLQIAGIQLTFLTAIIAGLSVAVGLALSGTLQNFVSGIIILYLRPYSVGDYVVMQGQEGIVTSIQLFHTFILTADNKTIIVPNGQLSNNVVINLSRQGKRRMDVSLKFAYNVSIEKVKDIVKQAIDATDNILSALEQDKFTLDIQAWVNVDQYDKAKCVLQEKVMEDFKKEGIISVPQ